MLYIFDLDDTTVDSSHRQGAILDEWKRLNTPANIAMDKPMALAHTLRWAKKNPRHTTMICTSRVLGDADVDWLHKHDMLADYILHRAEGDNTPCGWLKLKALNNWRKRKGLTWRGFTEDAVIYDDNEEVLHVLGNAGLPVVDAKTQ